MYIKDCPYCGQEMKPGTLPNETYPYWLPDGKMAPPVRFVVPKSGVTLVVRSNSLLLKKATAYYCPNCKVVIAPTER